MSFYQPRDYPWIDPDHSGAAKLSTSAVAPLVALARGYASYTSKTVDELCKPLGIKTKNSARWHQMSDSAATGDMLYMPWYRVDDVDGSPVGQAPSTFWQYRPKRPIMTGDSDKGQKYINPAKVPTALDTHPATPTTLVRASKSVLFTEGLLKADSALTAALIDSGTSVGDLKVREGEDTAAARKRLNSYMAKLDVLIIAFVGVANWHSHYEWTSLRLNDRVAYMCFDADVATNPHVWKQANSLTQFLEEHRKVSSVGLLTLPDATGKQGIDDFFAGGHTWSDMFDFVGPLPSRPHSDADDYRPGQWRVTEDGAATEEAYATKDGTILFRPQIDIGGRISRNSLTRVPEDNEVRTGILAPPREGVTAEESSDTIVDIELSWKEGETVCTATVTGPSEILQALPKDWSRLGASVPASVKMLEQWPPESQKWVSAIKANRREEVISATRWGRMGWVPTNDGKPEFIIGNERVSTEGIFHDADTVSAVIDDDPDYGLTGASKFGVIAPPRATDWRTQALKDAREVITAYLGDGTTPGAWAQSVHGAIALALMARPAIPVRSKIVPYLYGPPASGKSWTAAAIMMGWQSHPGTWTNTSLSGSARDTVAATEISVSRAPVWVMDDLAPSVNRMKAEREADALGDLIRSVHDTNPKKRSSRGLNLQKTHSPSALFLVTAENPPTISSIMSRISPIHFESHSLVGIDTIEDLGKRGVQSRLIGAYLRYLAGLSEGPESRGWERSVYRAYLQYRDGIDIEVLMDDPEYDLYVATLHEGPFSTSTLNDSGTVHFQLQGLNTIIRSILLEEFPEISSGDLERLIVSTSDICISLLAFLTFVHGLYSDSNDYRKIVYVDTVPSESDEPWMTHITKYLDVGLSRGEVNKQSPLLDIARYFARSVLSQNTSKPGASLVEALRDVLSSGKANLLDLAASSTAPAVDDVDPALVGWVPDGGGGYRPGGDSIGFVTERDGRAIALLNPGVAFDVAQRRFPKRIPYGTTSLSSWSSVWNEGLAYTIEDGGWAREDNRVTVRMRSGGETSSRLRVVPLELSVLLSGGIL
ncbi:DUF3854 domain-containing protein [Changpingibacter yushuensis]|uniref:DUF3854 domain-containing protein n=1 Tax=Changpingibacter yushuensis TaxID=2758440 RepID=UPI0015F727CF|nr:DUF3854 domain-containing protein [Changpingibacter yushuensis]